MPALTAGCVTAHPSERVLYGPTKVVPQMQYICPLIFQRADFFIQGVFERKAPAAKEENREDNREESGRERIGRDGREISIKSEESIGS